MRTCNASFLWMDVPNQIDDMHARKSIFSLSHHAKLLGIGWMRACVHWITHVGTCTNEIEWLVGSLVALNAMGFRFQSLRARIVFVF